MANGITSTFQVAVVSRPLMSVGKLCDGGMDVIFGKTRARVVDQLTGEEVKSFERQIGSLYVAKLKLKRPKTDFGRQG